MKANIWAGALGILGALNLEALAKPAQQIIPVNRSAWTVTSDGKATRIPFDFNDCLPTAYDPAPSPDQKLIAFRVAANVWLLDLVTYECTQLTPFRDQPEDDKWQHIPFVKGWSRDGSKVYYEITRGDYAYGEGEGGGMNVYKPDLHECKKVSFLQKEPQLRQDAFGEFRVGVADKKIERVSAPLTFVGRKPLGFIETMDPPAVSNDLQAFVSPDLKRVVYAQTTGDQYSQILLKSLPSSEPTEVSPRGSFAEYQWPTFSPDGKHIAYLRNGNELVVDGKALFKSEMILRYWWIGNSAIAVDKVAHPKAKVFVLRYPGGKLIGEFVESKTRR